MPPTDTFFALQTAVAGRYSLVREIGRGGMGIVYLARDVALDRPVAIKLLPPSLAGNIDLRERFLREARMVARLTHPNIVPIHAVEERDGLVFFVMSYIDGETLGTRVQRGGPLSPSDALGVIRDVAWALAHAHARGIVHRDVKPDNVLLESESGRAVVTDFGIAAATGMETPSGGSAIGTPQYLSPEQARGQDAEPRSDLYSLGATAWFALTGAPPFEGSTTKLLHQHATQALAPIASVRAGVPASLGRVIDRCLAKRPEDRPPSADALAAELGLPSELTIPAPVRTYLQAVSGTEVQLYAVVGFTAAAVATALNALPVPPHEIFNANAIAATIAAFASAASFIVSGTVLAIRVRHVRELTRGGYDYAAVARAVESERRRLRTEGDPRSPRRATLIGAAGAVCSIGMGMLAMRATSFAPGFAAATAAVAGLLLTVRGVANAVSTHVPGVKGRGFRAIERWMFRVFGDKNAPRAVGAGEPTVVALGETIADLWAALPPHVRDQFAEVPRIANNLEQEAMRVREPGAENPERLRTVVAAMEALRLDLLRINAGTVETSALTTQLEALRAVGAHIDALVEGREEVEKLLRRETTPV